MIESDGEGVSIFVVGNVLALPNPCVPWPAWRPEWSSLWPSRTLSRGPRLFTMQLSDTRNLHAPRSVYSAAVRHRGRRSVWDLGVSMLPCSSP